MNTLPFFNFYKTKFYSLNRIMFKNYKKSNSNFYLKNYTFFFKSISGLSIAAFLFYFFFVIRLNLNFKNLFFNKFFINGKVRSLFNFLSPKNPVLRYNLNFSRKNKNLFFKLLFFIINNNAAPNFFTSSIAPSGSSDNTIEKKNNIILINNKKKIEILPPRGGNFKFKFFETPLSINMILSTNAQIFTNFITNCLISNKFVEIYHNVSVQTCYTYNHYLFYKKRFIKTPKNIIFSGEDAFDFNTIFLPIIFTNYNYGIFLFFSQNLLLLK